jgi:hypothetical protein
LALGGSTSSANARQCRGWGTARPARHFDAADVLAPVALATAGSVIETSLGWTVDRNQAASPSPPSVGTYAAWAARCAALARDRLACASGVCDGSTPVSSANRSTATRAASGSNEPTSSLRSRTQSAHQSMRGRSRSGSIASSPPHPRQARSGSGGEAEGLGRRRPRGVMPPGFGPRPAPGGAVSGCRGLRSTSTRCELQPCAWFR